MSLKVITINQLFFYRFTLGYDGGDKLVIGLATHMAAYCLVESSREYAPLYEPIYQKVEISRIVIQFLLDKYWENPVYEYLLKHVKSFGKYSNPENILLQNAKFIYQQVSGCIANCLLNKFIKYFGFKINLVKYLVFQSLVFQENPI